MRANAVMLGLVLGVAGWLAAPTAADAAPMAPAKDAFAAARTEVEHVGNRAARAHKARPARATLRKASRSAMMQRFKKSAEKAHVARKGHLERFARHHGQKTAEVHKRDHRSDKTGERRHIEKPIDPQKHYRRQVGDWSRHDASHEGKRHHAHNEHGKDAWKDHFRRKKDKDGKDSKDGEDRKKTKVSYLGSIDHKRSHDGNDDYDNDYDNGYRNRGDRYYSGRGVYVDDNNNDDDDNGENGDREEKKADNTTYRDCEKGRDCDVKMKWIRVPVKEEKEDEVPLK